MHRAANILTARMIDGLMPITALRITDAKRIVNSPLIGAEQTDFAGDNFAHEPKQFFGVNRTDNFGDNVSLTLERADYGSLAGADTTTTALATATLADVTVLRLATNESLI